MKIIGQSWGPTAKTLLLTTALMGAGIVLTPYPIHAAGDTATVKKTWETELTKTGRALNNEMKAFYDGTGTLQNAIGLALHIKNILIATADGFDIDPAKGPSDEEFLVMAQGIYTSAACILLNALSYPGDGAQQYLDIIQGRTKDYFESHQDDKKAKHQLIVEALYAQAIHDIAHAWFKPEEAAKFSVDVLWHADLPVVQAVQRQITHWQGKIDTLGVKRSGIADISTIKIPTQINQESVAQITPSIILDISDRMENQQMKINAKNIQDKHIPPHDNGNIIAFAKDMAAKLIHPNKPREKEWFYNMGEKKMGILDQSDRYDSILKALTVSAANPVWTKKGGLLGTDTVAMVHGFGDKPLPWHVGFSDILARWAATCMHFNDLKDHLRGAL